jgi:putative toxin-antitoxin system antitoxin component (TIGR02293 family)
MKAPTRKRPPKPDSSLPGELPASRDFVEAVDLIRAGYLKRSVAELAGKLQVTQEHLLQAVSLSPRTIRGRKNRLTALETDRLVRVEQVFQKASAVLGSQQNAVEWMTSPAYGFGGIKPLDMLDTEVGTREVFNLLGSIEYGQYY